MFKQFYRFPAVLAMCLCASSLFAEQAPNPRSAVAVGAKSARQDTSKVVTRGDGSSNSVVSRSANSARNAANSVNVSARSSVPVKAASVARTGRNTTVKQASVGAMTNRSASVVRSASTANMGRSAVAGVKNNARSATKSALKSGVARAANVARATAVFSDISKIGGSYSQCRDAYATCMDQFCAANETFRRCYCSERYSGYIETEATFEEAKLMLQNFEDRVLNAVDKTASEVEAMYSATEGEAALKTKDTSEGMKMLEELNDMLSGKKKPAVVEKKTTLDLGSLNMDFSVDMENIWSGGSVDSLFGGKSNSRGGPNMSAMAGDQLYKESNKQCLDVVAEACSSDALLNMATSSYSLLITQDCNLYEKKLDAQRQSILNTTRDASKMLLEARLEEERSHNSADMNACMDAVREAILKESACGPNFKRCLDMTGNYINPSTGEAILKPSLFKLTELTNLFDPDDPVNKTFKEQFNGKRIYAEGALDTCRNIADEVWTEFTNMAIIEIGQAQEAKIEEVKNNCLATVSKCYEQRSGEIKDFGGSGSESVGAISANAARAMCAEELAGCAALYAPSENANGCAFDNFGRVTNAGSCGMTALLDFVSAVDSVNIAEGCKTGLTNYAKELCTPPSASDAEASGSDGTLVYPWGCRLMARDKLEETFAKRAKVICDVSSSADDGLSTDLVDPSAVIRSLVDNISNQIRMQLSKVCVEQEGLWFDSMRDKANDVSIKILSTVKDAKGKKVANDGNAVAEAKHIIPVYKPVDPNVADLSSYLFVVGANSGSLRDALGTYGSCQENSVKLQCEAIAGENNMYASYNSNTNTCDLTEAWYQEKCSQIGGYYENGVCNYVWGN
ncbi:MAG: hypothetical protein IKZ34_01700 [Alphaproteobacteria bacterium]|nr:hypothetical protein [Alphaproteobacteria bacterium]